MATGKARRRRAQQQRRKGAQAKLVQREKEEFSPGPKEYTLRHRAAKLSEIIVMYPQQIAMGLAKREEAGWLFGRLYLVGAIDRDQRIAAERLSRAVSTYRRLLHRYSGVRISNPEIDSAHVDGMVIKEDLSPQAEKRFVRASEEFNKHIEILRACDGEVESAVLGALETDRPTNLDLIIKGLDALYREMF